MVDEIQILKRALERERFSRKAAEEILEEKSAELYEAKRKLEESHNELLKLYGNASSQLQGVFENIVDPYVIMDLWGNPLKMNDAAIDLLDYEEANKKDSLLQFVNPEDLEIVTAAFKTLITKGSLTGFKLQLVTAKRLKKYVHINCSIIYEDGVAVAAQGVLRDITEEINYQKRIEGEREKYMNIINNMNLGLLEVNIKDEVLFVNQRFCKISGYSKEELLGKQAGELIPLSNDKETIKQENANRLLGESNSYEIKVLTKSGELRNWLISGAPNYNLKGEVIGSIGIHLDITDFRLLQSEKEKLLIELEKSNEELNEYAHIVSHDLKSPLRSINALISWIKEDNKDSFDHSTIKNFDLIEATLEKMEQLISNLLDYSSIGENNIEREMVDTNQLIKDLKKVLYVPKHITVHIKDTLPTVYADRIKLQQLFQNLISNAVKFNNKNKGVIEIGCEEQKERYQFSVSDNGIGIDPKYHEKIFKIFQSLSDDKESSGIGLSIVKKVVDLHSGKIWLESELDKGSTFYFTMKK
ncbi:PAS domain-containing sensor histidine kinase [Winogradskyella aurantiaca]|uniref:PAS domain-containing sensor histidine kinase n=1 Tax=Winogradskyella aurantiaca TaxID=2219558 RepID=UPI001E4D5768|nr:PAS domain-containing sensor histidine kinase [Winogradskyella aurantiaca]